MVVTLAVVVDGATEGGLEAGARQVLAHVRPHWLLHTLHFKRYTSGVTNTLVGVWCHAEAEQVLVRVYGNNTHLFIDRQQEIHTMQVVQEAGCGPKVFAAFTNGLCYAFTPGEPLTFRDVTREAVWRAVTLRAASFHKIQIDDKQEAMLFPKLRQFLALLPDSFTDAKTQTRVEESGCTKQQLLQLTEELETHLVPLACPVVFCHNDLVMRNIIWDEHTAAATFIDYEYAGPNYQPFDIANHFNEYSGMEKPDFSLCPSPETQRTWLRSYLAEYSGVPAEQVSPHQVEVWRGWVTKFTLASHLFWSVWAFLQACHSSIDFDYIEYGIVRLAEYNSRKKEVFDLVLLPLTTSSSSTSSSTSTLVSSSTSSSTTDSSSTNTHLVEK
ncbi:LOW QUALITY PROTEIN: ethanolamine kinase 1 [Procambarus clarkii]|uniref:LOW QUALITY PROTEIN: ethanolamine kinase 1 n=1 Tax=Procambarus clarkii TaxID=6728 RepID=UPI001E678918|nr:ethanolamine kinase 1-like isoform X2 [Procambarus clarkii]